CNPVEVSQKSAGPVRSIRWPRKQSFIHGATGDPIIMKSSTRSLTFALCGSIVATMAACGQEPALADEQPYVAPPPAQSEQQAVRQLEQLVAPIALYPDELVAEILTAATYPTEVVEAWRWMQQHPDLKG